MYAGCSTFVSSICLITGKTEGFTQHDQSTKTYTSFNTSPSDWNTHKDTGKNAIFICSVVRKLLHAVGQIWQSSEVHFCNSSLWTCYKEKWRGRNLNYSEVQLVAAQSTVLAKLQYTCRTINSFRAKLQLITAKISFSNLHASTCCIR